MQSTQARPQRTEPALSNEDMEAATLGALLIDRDSIVKVSSFLMPEDFSQEKNGWIYRVIAEMYEHNRPADFTTLCDEMERRGILDDCGGPAYLTSLINSVYNAVHIETYARGVAFDGKRRRLSMAAAEFAKIVYQARSDDALDAQVEEWMQRVHRGMSADSDVFLPFPKAVGNFAENQDKIEAMCKSGNAYPTVPWRDLQKVVPAYTNKQLILIGAPTRMGKTIYMMQVAMHNAAQGQKVDYYHPELSHDDMVLRAGSFLVKPLFQRDRVRGAIDREALAELGTIPDSAWQNSGMLTLVHCPGWGAARVADAIRQRVARGECTLAVVDYLNKLNIDDEASHKGRSDEMLLALSADRIKTAGEIADIPILLGSQVNREYHNRADKEPYLVAEDLRGSGQLAEKANVIHMIWNPCAADPNLDHRIVTIYTPKNTLGPEESIQLRWEKERFAFVDLELKNPAYAGL